MISVIIPTYNSAHLVADALTSVVAQGQPGVEIETVVVDDGSQDNTREVVDAFGSQVKYIWQKNGGAPAARNTGLRAATGEIIAFLDADDIWRRDTIARQMETIRQNPNAGFWYCGWRHLVPDGTRWKCFAEWPGWTQEKEPRGRDLFAAILRRRFFLNPSGLVVDRKALEQVGDFNEALPAAEDTDLTLRLAWRYPGACTNAPLVDRRWHGGNTVANIRPPALRCLLIAEHWLSRRAELSREEVAAVNHWAALHNYMIGASYLAEGRTCEARGYLVSAAAAPGLRMKALLRLLTSLLPGRCASKLRPFRRRLESSTTGG